METNYKTLPNLPGVYLFKNAQGIVIYIGKAKSLKLRVRSYFHNDTDWKVQALLQEAHKVDYILTQTETEALLLEAQLVQEYSPKFNILLKTGQPFVYLVVTNDFFPELIIVRSKTKNGTYFGPFIHKQQARSVHSFLTNTFKLFCCNKKIENGCLDYHLGRCAGTCMKTFDKIDYIFRLSLAQDVLKKDHKEFLKKLATKIKDYSNTLEFEKARTLNQYNESIESIFAIFKTKFSQEKYASEVAIATSPFQEIDNYPETAQKLKELLNLKNLPETIDCFDISHFQSQALVGSCVRFTHGKPDKNKFRKFKIKTLTEQNDYAALYEVVARRYKNPENLPDLVLIDGGKGQRNAVLSLLPNTPCVSLAKKEELLFSDIHPQGIPLCAKDPVGKLLISLRDYAHHFAISYHRLTRSKER